MTDIQDGNNMSTDLEEKICVNGDVGSLTCALKNEQNHSLNGVNGVEKVMSNGTGEPELPDPSEKDVKMNGNVGLETSNSTFTLTEKPIEEDLLNRGENVAVKIDSVIPIDLKNPEERNDNNLKETEATTQSTEYAGTSIERSEETKSSDVQAVKSAVEEKRSLDVEEISKNEKDDAIVGHETSNFGEKSEVCGQTIKTGNESTVQTESEKTEKSASADILEVDEPLKTEETHFTEENVHACEIKSSDESTKQSEIGEVTIENGEKSIEKIEFDSSNRENNVASETIPVVTVQEPSENPETSEETTQNDVEKMEVDENEATLNGTESLKSTDEEKSNALINDCRVVLVKMNESQPEGSMDLDQKTEVPIETNKGIKRKRSSENDSLDEDKSKSKEDEQKENSVSPVRKNKKQKLESQAKETSEEVESQLNDEKSASSARKSKRLSNKSDKSKDNEEPVRKSSRSAVKKEIAPPESEKSPSKQSRQSTPRKSITPSPRSRSKKGLESTDEKSASESDKTPQKNYGTRASPRSKRKLNLDDDEKARPSTASKKLLQSSKVTPKREVHESSDEDQVSEEEKNVRSAKKSRKSKPKSVTKRTKNSTAKSDANDDQDVQSESDSDGEAVDSNTSRSRKSRSSQAVTKKLEKMKRLLIAANLKQNNYNKFFKDCGTDEEKITHIENFLREHGLKGEFTLQNCKKLAKKIEKDKEVASLDKSNIIDSSPSTSGTRVTRSRRSVSRCA